MVTPLIVVLDEARDLGFENTGQIIVLEQNAVLERRDATVLAIRQDRSRCSSIRYR